MRPLVFAFVNLYQNPKGFLSENRKIHPKTHVESPGTQKAKTILKKENKGEWTVSHTF